MIFHFATTGNISGIRELLEDGAASPDDVKCDGGFTPLHVSCVRLYDPYQLTFMASTRFKLIALMLANF
jgi:hypothetical protein